MQFSKYTKLETLFWEIKSRWMYILIAFVLSFAVAYQNSKLLLYLFTLPSKNLGKNAEFIDFGCITVSTFTLLQKQAISFINNLSTSLSDLVSLSLFLDSIDCSSMSFIFTDVEEAFSSLLSISLFFSFISVIPFIIYQSFSFFLPSLYLNEMRRWIIALGEIVFLWLCFVYKMQTFLIPKLAQFLLDFQISSFAFNLSAETKINAYCSWASSIFIATNLVFFFIVSIFILLIQERIKISFFISRRKGVVCLILLISAFISPPGWLQMVLSLTFFFFFETLLYSFFVYKHSAKKRRLVHRKMGEDM